MIFLFSVIANSLHIKIISLNEWSAVKDSLEGVEF